MSETRSVVIRLRAEVDQYKREMKQAEDYARSLERRLNSSSDTVRKLARSATGLAAAFGVGGLIKDAVQLEAAYSKTMAQVAVATEAPKNQLKALDDLAIKMGQDTVFSANDAAQAMLELAKGGLSSAQIKAGALADTMTLAAAGGLDLGEAANTVVQSMGAFQLKATEADSAVAALAGAANASSADVSDMTQALSQAGTSANAAGLSIQDTTAFLALFADQGFKGSDAGTSLRTMLSRLVPQTAEARAAMEQLGLTYTDANGQLVSAEEIAGRTREAFRELSDEERIRAVNQIFGADAQRAVNALTVEGVDGFRDYKKATSDLTQAQKLADAANSGTAGSLEELSGQIETALIQVGKGLAPAIRDLSGDIGDLIEGGDFERWAQEAGEAVTGFVDVVGPVATSTLPVLLTTAEATGTVLKTVAPLIKQIADAYNSLPEAAQTAILVGAGATYLANKVSPLAAASAGAAAGAGASSAGSAAGSAAKGSSAGLLTRTTLGRSTGIIGVAGILGSMYNEKLLESLPKRYEDLRRSAMTANEVQRETLSLRDEIFGEDLGGGGGITGVLWAFEDLGERTMLATAGMGAYADELMKLPNEVTTKIATPGVVESLDDVIALARQYGLTPEEVETIMKAKDFATKDIQEAVGYLYSVDGDSATLHVDANTRAARQAIGGLLSFANSLPGISIPIGPGGYTGGQVPPGYAGGGIVPGRPPADPKVDNVLAITQRGNPLRVRSGEWIVNERSSRENSAWLALINSGLKLDDVFKSARSDMLRGYAAGGQVDAATTLDVTRMRIRIRDLERSLRETEKYGKKNKRTRLALRGLDRVEANLELRDARAEYAATLRANRAQKSSGLSVDAYNASKESAKSFRDTVDISSFSTPAQVERSLERSIADMGTFTSLLIALKKKGAAPWLLQQLQSAGPSKSAIRLARRYLTDSAALARVNADARQLEQVSSIYGQVTSNPKWEAAGAWSGGLSAGQSNTLNLNVNAVGDRALTNAVEQIVVHKVMPMLQTGAGAGT